MSRQYTVEELEQYRLWWSRLVDSIFLVSAFTGEEGEDRFRDESLSAVRGDILDAASPSGEGNCRKFVRQFSRRIQCLDRSSADVAEYSLFRKAEEPTLTIAPTALDASAAFLEELATEVFYQGVAAVRVALSQVEFDLLEIRRLECRMEREASLLMDAESIAPRVPDNAAGKTDEDWPVTLEEFMRLTMRDGKGGTSWPSIYQFTVRARRELGEDVLPLRPKFLPYLKAAEIWNRTSTTPVPTTVEAAQRHLESAQPWRIRSRPR